MHGRYRQGKVLLLDSPQSNLDVSVDYGLTRERPHLYIQCNSAEQRQWFASGKRGCSIVASLASAESASLLDSAARTQANCATAVVNETLTVLMELSGSLLEKELKRLSERQVYTCSQLVGLNVDLELQYYLPKFPCDKLAWQIVCE